MAGDYVIFRHVTPEKPEIWKLSEILDIPRDHALGLACRFFIWFDQHTENGHAPNVTLSRFSHIMSHPGFAEALQQVGWLEEAEQGIRQVRFDSHTSESAKTRAKNNERQRRHRLKGSGKQEDSPPKPPPKPSQSDAKEPPKNVTQVSQDARDEIVTIEQNRTEQKRTEQNPQFGGARLIDSEDTKQKACRPAWEVEALAAKISKPVLRSGPTQLFVDVARCLLGGSIAENAVHQSIEACIIRRKAGDLESPEAYFRSALANQCFGQGEKSLLKLKTLLSGVKNDTD